MAFQPWIAKFQINLSLTARTWERIQDKRFDAYEAMNEIAQLLRTTIPTGQHENGFVETVPIFLQSKAHFYEFYQQISDRQPRWDNWVDHRTNMHLCYLRDYLTNLKIAVLKSPDKQMAALALAAKPDLIELSVETHKASQKFFAKINKRKLRIRGNGKYPLRRTEDMLSKTNLSRFMEQHKLLAQEGETVPSFSGNEL